jgi:hypothetical protein
LQCEGSSALALLVSRVGANDTDHTLATDDLAVAADLLDGCGDFHGLLLDRLGANVFRDSEQLRSLRPENDASMGKIVRRAFDSDLVTRLDADVVHTHLPGDMAEHSVLIFELHAIRCFGKVLDNLTQHLNDVIF